MGGHGELWRAAGAELPAHEAEADARSAWGRISATLDWCEENYAVLHNVAELWNSSSNVLVVALGLHGAYRAASLGLPTRIVLVYLALALIGAGSAAFHGTLRFDAQLLDEIPMLVAAACALYCCSPPAWRSSTSKRVALGSALATLTLTVSAIYVYTRHVLFFEGSFAAASVVVFARCLGWTQRRANDAKTANARLAIRVSAVLLAGSFLAWNIDNFYCVQLRRMRLAVGPFLAPLFQLHAWWHIGTGISGALLATFLTTFDEPGDGDDAEAAHSKPPTKGGGGGNNKKPTYAIVLNSWGIPQAVRVKSAP